jgi:hypothetical protein
MSFGHHDFGAALCAGMNIHFIHKRSHQQNASAGITEDILIVARIGHILKPKSRALIHHMDHQLLFMQFECQVDLSLAALLIAILKGVHHAFMHGETNLILVILAKPSRLSDTNTHLFGESNALDQRLQNHFNPLRFRGHPAVGFRLGTCMGNIAQSPKSIQYRMLGEIAGGVL